MRSVVSAMHVLSLMSVLRVTRNTGSAVQVAFPAAVLSIDYPDIEAAFGLHQRGNGSR